MKYLSDKNLSERYGVSRATVWRWTREGKFPNPIKITEGCTRWSLADIEKWEKQAEVRA